MTSPTTAKPVDKILLGIVLILVVGGFFVFSSAGLGLLARNGASFSSVAFTQIVLGIGGGLLALFVMSRIHYRIWRKFSFYFFLFAIGLSLLVFTGLGMEHGGARRWLDIAGFSFQPSEILKVAFVIYVATWFSAKHKIKDDFLYSLLPFLISVGVVGVVVLLQKDTDTFLIMVAAGITMFFVRSGRWKEILAILVAGVILLAILASVHDYLRLRLMSFVNPALDPHGVGWQVNQSLIAVGSGGLHGRGFGQSIQKFEYLPEPIGDSIFAVFAEEFGFIGTFILIMLFCALAFRGYRLAARAPDDFGMLLVIGITTMIILQAFLHIAAMVKFAPVLGLPLPFISHGGTAMLVTLASVGIILNVSKFQKHRPG